MVMSEPGTAAAATNQKAADEGSPGTVRLAGRSVVPPVTATLFSEMVSWAPNAFKARSEWSLVGVGSCTRVVPFAWRPAKRMALFTCALATGGV